MKNSSQLTRTCLSCGLEKSLAAFLQITGSQGTIYGNICSSCRSSSAKGKPLPQIDLDEGRSGSSGLRIDSKRKLQTEIEQKKAKKKSITDTLEEKKKVEKTSEDKIAKIEKTGKEEKDHRKTYLEAKKKQSFLLPGKKGDTGKQQKVPPQRDFISEHEHALEAEKLESSLEHEEKLTNVDTAQMYVDSQFGELKFQSVIFKQFQEWMGGSANFKVMDRLLGKEKVKDTTSGAAAKETKEKNLKGKDALVDYIEQTKPNSNIRRR